jgi:hypothetical protein
MTTDIIWGLWALSNFFQVHFISYQPTNSFICFSRVYLCYLLQDGTPTYATATGTCSWGGNEQLAWRRQGGRNDEKQQQQRGGDEDTTMKTMTDDTTR